jgi:hypothetical protein
MPGVHEPATYDEQVSFPVVLRGRDGRARRFTFEDAMVAYERRVAAAMVDGDPHGEIRHCRARIDQLRKSYLAESPTRVPAIDLREADVVALVVREVGHAPDALRQVTSAWPGARALAVVGVPGMIAHCWEGGAGVPRAALEAYARLRRQGREAGGAIEIERPVALHNGRDVAILLSSAGATGAEPRALTSVDDTLREAVSLVRAGCFGHARVDVRRRQRTGSADGRLLLLDWVLSHALRDLGAARSAFFELCEVRPDLLRAGGVDAAGWRYRLGRWLGPRWAPPSLLPRPGRTPRAVAEGLVEPGWGSAH